MYFCISTDVYVFLYLHQKDKSIRALGGEPSVNFAKFLQIILFILFVNHRSDYRTLNK